MGSTARKKFIRQPIKDNLFCRAYGERKRENILSKAYRSLVLDLSRNITAISLLLRLRLVLFCYGYGYGLSSSVTAISVLLFLFCSVCTSCLSCLSRFFVSLFRLSLNSVFLFLLFLKFLLFRLVFSLYCSSLFFSLIPKEKFRNKTYSRNSRREKTLAEKKTRKWTDS